MTDRRPIADEERNAQAIAWLVRMTSDEAGDEAWRALEAWLAEDPANLAAYARAERLWAEVGELAEPLKAGLDAQDAARPAEPIPNVIPFAARPRKPAARRPMFGGWRAAAAAAVVLAVGGGTGLGLFSLRPTTYQTAPGHARRIALADGTRIDLNGGSKIAVRFDSHARRVSMGDAEAAFDVTHDPKRPFLIAAGSEQIRVVGTAFDVVHEDGRLVVTVRRGVVQVAQAGEGGALSDVQRVPAGYQLVAQAGAPAQVAPVADPNEAFAWREGRLVFRDAPLSEVASALNRAFTTPIEARGDAGTLRFSGVLVLDDEGAVVRRLQAFLPVEADRSQDRIVLVSRP